MSKYFFRERIKTGDEYFKVYESSNDFKIQYFKNEDNLSEFNYPKVNHRLNFPELKRAAMY